MTASKGAKTMSQKAIDANRANAQKSTGPKTIEGKEKSRQNACIHHGYATMVNPVLPNESMEQYEALRQSYMAMFRPQNVWQVQLMDNFVAHLWAHNRFHRHEVDAMVYCADPGHQHEELERISRIQARKWRAVVSTLNEFRKTQRLGETENSEIEWPSEAELRLPSHIPDTVSFDGAPIPVGYEEEPDGGIPNRYTTRNPEITSGKYNKLLDHQLGLLNTPNPSIKDIIQRRVQGLPLGSPPPLKGLSPDDA